MTPVDRKAGDFVIDAALLAEALSLTDVEVGQQMRIGAIRSRCELGVGEDAGKWRITYFYGDRACRFAIGKTGNLVQRATVPIKKRPDNPFEPHQGCDKREPRADNGE